MEVHYANCGISNITGLTPWIAGTGLEVTTILVWSLITQIAVENKWKMFILLMEEGKGLVTCQHIIIHIIVLCNQ